METLLITLPPLPPGSGPALRDSLTVLLAHHPHTTTVLCDVSALTRPTHADLDHLLQLRLTTHRTGRSLALSSPSWRLTFLLELAGLTDQFTPGPVCLPPPT